MEDKTLFLALKMALRQATAGDDELSCVKGHMTILTVLIVTLLMSIQVAMSSGRATGIAP